MHGIPVRRALLAPTGLRNAMIRTPLALSLSRVSSSAVPKVARPSFWKAMVPKFLRSETNEDPFGTIAAKKAKKAKEWNPATFFIVIFLLIGSMSIQMISLKKDFATFIRRTDVKIGLLREVVEKLQRGEKVDVERALGTGEPEKELEWEQVLKDIEEGEIKRKQRKRKNAEPSQEPGEKIDTTPSAEPLQTEQQAMVSTRGQFF